MHRKTLPQDRSACDRCELARRGGSSRRSGRAAARSKPARPVAPCGSTCPNTDFDFLDPALSYASWAWQFTYLTNYKLLNFPDKAAPEGGKLVPKQLWGFRLSRRAARPTSSRSSPGAKFNTGEAVTAQSFAHAINRVLNPGMQSPAVPFIIDIVGAQAVVDGKAATASGVKVSGNKLTINLTQPAGGLPRPDHPAVLRGDPGTTCRSIRRASTPPPGPARTT